MYQFVHIKNITKIYFSSAICNHSINNNNN